MENRYSCQAMGDLTGLRVLDGACGTGFYSQMMVLQRAAEVIGVDISSGMIENAKKELAADWKGGSIRYMVGDFEQTDLLQSLGLGEMRETYDVVFAAWLLNYAADWHHMSKMLRNIFEALKPGGKLIGLTPHPFLLKQHGPEMTPEESCMGDRWQVTEAYDYGFKVHLIANALPSVEFDSYILYETEYKKAAEAAEFLSLSWQVSK